MIVTVNSTAEVLYHVMTPRSDAMMKSEPMLFNCDFDGAAELGGGITLEFIEKLPEEWKRVPLVIDSRVHMLMPGWYPCIPGWHHDDVPRTRSDGQPNYSLGQCRSEHITALVGGQICPTLFAIGKGEFEVPPLGKTIYSEWHREVESRIKDGLLEECSAPTNRLIRFNDRTWHRGTRAVANGWRFFIRASRYFDADGQPIARGNVRSNEVRRQVQVYLGDVNAGW